MTVLRLLFAPIWLVIGGYCLKTLTSYESPAAMMIVVVTFTAPAIASIGRAFTDIARGVRRRFTAA